LVSARMDKTQMGNKGRAKKMDKEGVSRRWVSKNFKSKV
jgi:hypothetical protein